MTQKFAFKVLILLLISIIFFSCNNLQNSEADSPIAQVEDKILFSSEIENLISENTSKSDSIQIVENFIENWLITQLKLRKAELNLSDNNDEIDRKVDNYRSTLLIYKYEQQFIKQKLDTIVTNEILQNYYDEFLNDFVLNWNIAKAIYVKIPKSAPQIYRFRRWFKNFDSNIDDVEDYINENAVDYNDFGEHWILFDSLISKYELGITDHESFLKTKKFFEKKEEANHHFINIQEYKLKNEVPPLSFVKSEIRGIILNKRKIELIKELNENVFTDGIKQNKFKIFK